MCSALVEEDRQWRSCISIQDCQGCRLARVSIKKEEIAPSSDDEHGDDDEPHHDVSDLEASPSKQKQPSPPVTDHGDDEDSAERETTPMGPEDADVDPGKGKIKASPVLWYDCLAYCHSLPSHATYCLSSPADVPPGPEHQFEFLFSLCKDEEYQKLLKQAGEVPVGPISTLTAV